MKKITPLGAMVLVKPFLAEDKVKAGLVLPDSYKQDRPDSGTVHAVGPSVKKLKPKTKVLFNRYAADDVELDDGEKQVRYLLLNESDIYAQFE